MDYSKSVAQHLNNKRSSWANGAEGTLGSTGAYNPNSETANLYKAAEEDGGSRVDDEAGWREVHRDNTPGSAEEYEAMVRKYAADGFDVKAIDMDKGFSHANFAIKPKDAGGEKKDRSYTLSETAAKAKAYTAAYEDEFLPNAGDYMIKNDQSVKDDFMNAYKLNLAKELKPKNPDGSTRPSKVQEEKDKVAGME